MRPNHRSRQQPRARGPIVWTVASLGALALAAGCGKAQQPLGTCTRTSDTTIVNTNVTQQQCASDCPNCTWTANES